MKNVFGESVYCYCILDRDYHPDEEIEERKRQAADRGVSLHVWNKKELENYLLEPSVIARVINRRHSRSVIKPKEILDMMLRLARGLQNEVIDGIADELCHLHRGISAGGANKKARKILESRESPERGLIDVVSGKPLLSKLSDWSQKGFGVSLSSAGLAREFRESEMHEELRFVITAIEELHPFN